MDVLELLQEEDYLTLKDIAIRTNLRIDQVYKQLKSYMQQGIVYYNFGRDINGTMKQFYFLNPDIVYIKNVTPKVEIWDSDKFLEENKKLQQMIDMEYML